MIFSDSRNFSRADAGLTRFDQYSIPVPKGNAISKRPFDMTSRIAYSSASRFGSMKFGGTPPNADPRPLDLRNQSGCHDVWRGHHAVHGVVMFVEHDGIEAKPVCQHKLLKVALVQLMPLHRIVKLIRKIDPGCLVLLMVLWQVHIRHEVHRVESKTCAHSLPKMTNDN